MILQRANRRRFESISLDAPKIEKPKERINFLLSQEVVPHLKASDNGCPSSIDAELRNTIASIAVTRMSIERTL